MKILQISSAKNFGGGEKHFVDLCKGLHNRGHEVFVVLRPTCEWRERLNFLPRENFTSVSIRNSFGIFSAQQIARFIRKNKIEIVHAHVARDYFPSSLACRIAKTGKFVLTRHVLFPMKSFHKFALNNLAKVIAVSSAVAKNLRLLFSEAKVVTVSNGVEIIDLTPERRNEIGAGFRAEHSVSVEALFIGTVGELLPLKGQEDFILAAQIIAKECPAAFFAIIGKDNSIDRSHRRKLKRLVRVFELEEKFLWLDWVENTTALFAALDIFVSPSHSEAFGLAILEAMASAKAIVSTETEGAKELLAGEKTGKLVPIDNPTEMATAVLGFLKDESLRASHGMNARAFAKSAFSLDRMVTETEAVYQSVLTTNV